ncbi:MAG: hypothetical protein O2992_04325 [Gemmatimonadetes bacterium]|nr:hypothetical protein [Gemmatimonadota bacterium]
MLLWCGPLTSQSTVRSARMYADLSPDDGGAEVRIDYELQTDGIAPLRFELLGFGDSKAEGFWFGDRDTGVPMRLEAEVGSMRASEFSLNSAAEDGAFVFTARYWIADAVVRSGNRVTVNVPVLSVALPPSPDAEEVFGAEVVLPDGWAVSGSFPTGISQSAASTFSVGLAVVPAVVTVRGRTDGVWRPDLALTLEVLAGLVLLVFGAFGIRHLRETMA